MRDHCRERSTCNERPLCSSWKWPKQWFWTWRERPPVLRDHFLLGEGVVSHDRFTCIITRTSAKHRRVVNLSQSRALSLTILSRIPTHIRFLPYFYHFIPYLLFIYWKIGQISHWKIKNAKWQSRLVFLFNVCTLTLSTISWGEKDRH